MDAVSTSPSFTLPAQPPSPGPLRVGQGPRSRRLPGPPRAANAGIMPCVGPSPAHGSPRHRFMKIDQENAKLEPFNSVNMVSGYDYAAALRVPGSFNWSKAIRTLLVQMDLNFLLPMTGFIRGKDGSDDPFALVGGSAAAYAILRESFSPLHLYAIGAPPPPPQGPPRLCRNALLHCSTASYACGCPPRAPVLAGRDSLPQG